jgi:hypothetical protein
MEKIGNPEQGDKRKGDRRQPAQDSGFDGPDRRKGERRAAASTAGERQSARGR